MPKKHAIRRLVSAVTAQPWAILPQKLDEIVELLNLRAAGVELSEDEVRERLADRETLRARIALELADALYEDDDPVAEGTAYLLTKAGTAIIPLDGVISPRMNLMQRFSGGTSTQQFAGLVRQAIGDQKVKSIVIAVDSPGGSVLGLEEAATAVREARAAKPIKAVITAMGASAAYYIAAAAGEVIAAPDAAVGSIGVIAIHTETSKADRKLGIRSTVISAGKYKGVGNSAEPLTAEGRAVVQEHVDSHYRQFVSSVAESRGISAQEVIDNYGQGKVLIGTKATEAGLVDRTGYLADVVADLDRLSAAGTAALSSSAAGTAAARSPLDNPPAQTEEVSPMDPKIKAQLVALGLIAPDAPDEHAQAILAAFFAARAKAVPDEVEAVLAELRSEPTATRLTAAGTAANDTPNHTAAGTAANDTARDARLQQQAAAEERARIDEIRARGALLSVEESVIQAAIDNGTAVPQFVDEVTRRMQVKKGPVSSVEPTESAQEKFAEAAVAVLARRCGVETDGDMGAASRSLQHASLLDIARESLRVANGRAAVGSPDDIARAALGMGPQGQVDIYAADTPYHTPGDFPNILSGLARKTLEAAPPYVGTTYQTWAYRRAPLPDFKPATLVRFGEFGEFPLHVDADDFEQSSLEEDYAWIQVDSYGDEAALTPKMILDDDLGAFTDALQDKSRAHDQTLNRLCIDLLTGNVNCTDGVALFNAVNHGNDRAAGNPPSTVELSAMRLLLRRQTGVGGRRKLNYTVNIVLVPEDLETVTEQLLLLNLEITPTTTATTEPFRGRIQWAVEPMLADHSTVIWYGFAAPAQARSIVYAHQRGFERMVTRNYFNPKNNCRMFQFEGRMAAAVNNYRGIVRNAGAGA